MQAVVISVNWRRPHDTAAMLDSLRASDDSNWVAVVCENGSPDNSVEVLRSHLSNIYLERERVRGDDAVRVFEYFENIEAASLVPKIVLVVSSENLGFAGGNNLALRYCSSGWDGAWYWFLNNDVEIQSDTLTVLKAKMLACPDLGMCGASVVFADGRNRVQALGGASYSPLFGRIEELGQGGCWPADVDEKAIERRLDYISGASMFVSAAFLKRVGPMSENYFLYFEELDWAVRARAAGFKLGYASKAVVFHKEGAVLGSGKSHKRSALAEFYGLRNRLVFTRKFYPWALPTVWLTAWAQVARRLIHGEWTRARLMGAVLLGLRKVAP